MWTKSEERNPHRSLMPKGSARNSSQKRGDSSERGPFTYPKVSTIRQLGSAQRTKTKLPSRETRELLSVTSLPGGVSRADADALLKPSGLYITEKEEKPRGARTRSGTIKGNLPYYIMKTPRQKTRILIKEKKRPNCCINAD